MCKPRLPTTRVINRCLMITGIVFLIILTGSLSQIHSPVAISTSTYHAQPFYGGTFQGVGENVFDEAECAMYCYMVHCQLFVLAKLPPTMYTKWTLPYRCYIPERVGGSPSGKPLCVNDTCRNYYYLRTKDFPSSWMATRCQTLYNGTLLSIDSQEQWDGLHSIYKNFVSSKYYINAQQDSGEIYKWLDTEEIMNASDHKWWNSGGLSMEPCVVLAVNRTGMWLEPASCTNTTDRHYICQTTFEKVRTFHIVGGG